jgi:hypothetical protein
MLAQMRFRPDERNGWMQKFPALITTLRFAQGGHEN